ncbi:sensor histidine kinase [Holophaga foetida]|uniref:sensor histidine kinase n=1 Tax=Holophaga foetida TaxID=35839 RepID=UPI0002471CA9|nr:histidine kinase [Holophaga foetida]
MRAPDALRQLKARLMSPYAWIAVATFGGMNALLSAFVEQLAPNQSLYGHIMSWVGRTVGAIGYGFLSPLPWQWTGDDREVCGHFRGSLQAILFGAALYALTGALDLSLAPHFSPGGHTTQIWNLPRSTFLIQILLMALVGLFITRGEMRDRERILAMSELREAKWVLLREQMSPHVLFNTLNTLAELARRDPAATEEALLDLSEMFERMLALGDRTMVTLGEELDILRRYLAIQGLRLGERLRVEWHCPANLDSHRLPPLLLQPLVENALKHGIASHPDGGTLRIDVSQQRKGLKVTIGNTGRPPGNRRPGATGLRNLQERLRLAYRGRARFSLVRSGEWTLATLELPEEPWT